MLPQGNCGRLILQGSSRDDVQRLLFWSNVLSGTAGFSYGAEGIWQFNTEEELFGASPVGNVWGNIPWETCSQYLGSTHMKVGKMLMEEFEYWEFEPHPEWVRSKDPGSVFAPYCAGIPDKVRLIYMNQKPSNFNPYTAVSLVPGKKYQYQFLDPMTGDHYPKNGFSANDKGEWEIPITPVMRDFVLVIRSISEPKNF